MKKIGKRSVIALVSILLFINSFSQLSYASPNDAFTEADMTTTQWKNWSNNWDSTIKSDLSKVALSPGKYIFNR